MTLWGSAADASKAVKLDVHPHDHRFPPLNPDDAAAHPAAAAGATKTHERPTGHLPGDNIAATGEAEHAAFATDAPAATATDRPAGDPIIQTPPADVGAWFAGALTGNYWILGALGAMIPLVLGAVLFVCLVRRRRTAEYERVDAEEEVPLTMAERRRAAKVSRAARPAQPTHAVGEASDEDEEEEEEGMQGGLPSVGDVGLHREFLHHEDVEGSPLRR